MPRPSLVGGSLVESLRRHLLVLVAVVLGLGATAVAALVLGFVDLSGSPSRLPDRHDGQAWYLHQTPPPQLVDLPDSPLLPDPPHDGGDRAAPAPARAPLMRPYEEALPTESYEPIRIPMPIPGRDAPARSAPPTPPAPTPTLTPPVGPPRSLLPDGAAPPGPESPAPAAAPAPQVASLTPPQAVPAPAAPPRWLRFSVPVRVPDGRPMLAIVIDDMGVDRRRSGRVMSLKGPLTLSFLTYADDLDRQTREAADAGHELMLHVAMAPRNERLDAGPNVLESGLDPTELRRRLAWGLARFGTFVGINNHMGSQFTADAEGMRVVMETLRDRGLLFLDSRTTADTVGARVAHEVGVPVVERNVFLDNVNTEKAVRARLDEAIAIARKRGYAVAIGHPRDATIAVLSDWLGRAADEGIAVVPVTAVVKR